MSKIIDTIDGVLVCDDRVLLIERTKPPFEDKYVFPGGHVEEGESLIEAVVRELQEEVGVEVSISDLNYLMKLDVPDRDPRPGRRVAHVFWARVSARMFETAEAGSDARAIHILPLNEICAEMMGFDHYLAIERLREVLK
ncbi:TPA: DNA hydrolase [Candidatus Uhrbacteria bacterium]|nr:DNA hydrolase [Candidatus Uhrbacteria bacterium]